MNALKSIQSFQPGDVVRLTAQFKREAGVTNAYGKRQCWSVLADVGCGLCQSGNFVRINEGCKDHPHGGHVRAEKLIRIGDVDPTALSEEEKAPAFVHPLVTLVSGIRVVNFSSAHEFVFSDGSVLAGCPRDMAEALKLEFNEEMIPNDRGWTDIKLSFAMSETVHEALVALDGYLDVDIVLVPFPVLEAIRTSGMTCTKARVQRKADRTSHTILADKFCC